MPLSLTGVVADAGGTFAVQTDATSTTDTLKSGSGTLFKVEINNTTNSSLLTAPTPLSYSSVLLPLLGFTPARKARRLPMPFMRDALRQAERQEQAIRPTT